MGAGHVESTVLVEKATGINTRSVSWSSICIYRHTDFDVGVTKGRRRVSVLEFKPVSTRDFCN